MGLSREKQIEEMAWGYIEPSIDLRCTKCAYVQSEMSDDVYLSAHDFYKEGWRVTPNHCYCPSCAKKHLKQS